MSIGSPTFAPAAAVVGGQPEGVHDAVIRALRRRPLGVLSLDAVVMVEGRQARAVIRLRLGADRFILSPCETGCLAVAVRLRPDLVAGRAFAEALALAARQAAARLDALNRFGGALPLTGEGR